MGNDVFALSPETRWLGRRLDVYQRIASTNLEAERLAACGAPDGTLVVADAQSAGRGRLGRSFFSPGGTSLYLSVLLRPELAPDEVHWHVFAAAVAVAETARERLPAEVPVAIKWPNDVQLGGRKTSGINLPAHVANGRVAWCVLGIGVNVNTPEEAFPTELKALATSFAIAGGRQHDRIEVAHGLLGRLESELDRVRRRAFGEVLDRWLEYFRMRGASVRVGGPGVVPGQEMTGTVEGVDEHGALLVRTRSGVERVLAGDVTLARPPVPDNST